MFRTFIVLNLGIKGSGVVEKLGLWRCSFTFDKEKGILVKRF